MPEEPPSEEKQCRICFDGPDAEEELGRLIRPCLCRGSISYVHLKCLQQWRNTSTSNSAFFVCPQCHYQYRFSRTRIGGLAANPVIVGGISGLVFTMIVMMSSFATTYFMSNIEVEPTTQYFSFFYVSPVDVAKELVRAAFRVIQEEHVFDDDLLATSPRSSGSVPLSPLVSHAKPSIIKRFIRRFILGLPLVGAGSLVHMFLSMQFLRPVQMLARYRGSRNRRDNSRDIAALIIVGLLILGALRALYKVYQLTQNITKRVLLRAEDAILEVN
ncbi:hypothetical protein BDQ12DRAFT_733552 [Crucibulum laeve]|uniref:RING-CH-type domain-containing protein n=1 Tax=Crucibulum laeve TaxID=68775 RepID=A0A5C3M963_9AGAR|nr:hypothetical protein BDQ12DRAFT_733552 [Crucibulum laeve]